jgi:serine/threonine protein kinase
MSTLDESSGERVANLVRDAWNDEFDKWTEIGELGHGSFGVVKLMQDQFLNQLYAVKYFNPDKNNVFDTDAFLREIGTHSNVDHPCVLRIIGCYFPSEKCPSGRIVTVYYQNGSMEDIIDKVGSGNSPDFWDHTNVSIMIAGIILGLRYLHSRDIVHRDIKPGNIFVDQEFRTRVGDLGLARGKDVITMSRYGAGTPEYMAPELDGNRSPTKQSDIFAFGLVLYEILVGRFIFPRTSDSQQNPELLAMRTEGWRPMIPDCVNPLMQDIIKRCWARDPAERLSCDGILELLDATGYPFYIDDLDVDAVRTFVEEVKSQERLGRPSQ